jgi:hypothetical protein
MAKILSFEVSDAFYERLIGEQQKEGVNYLSPFLRTLVEEALSAHEKRYGKEAIKDRC